jgi:hypothetical protein
LLSSGAGGGGAHPGGAHEAASNEAGAIDVAQHELHQLGHDFFHCFVFFLPSYLFFLSAGKYITKKLFQFYLFRTNEQLANRATQSVQVECEVGNFVFRPTLIGDWLLRDSTTK